MAFKNGWNMQHKDNRQKQLTMNQDNSGREEKKEKGKERTKLRLVGVPTGDWEDNHKPRRGCYENSTKTKKTPQKSKNCHTKKKFDKHIVILNQANLSQGRTKRLREDIVTPWLNNINFIYLQFLRINCKLWNIML